MTKQQPETMETKEGAEWGFPPLEPASPSPQSASNTAEAQQTMVMQAVNVPFRATQPELWLIWTNLLEHIFRTMVILLAACPSVNWVGCHTPPQWSSESCFTTDAPNTSSLLIKVKKHQILLKRGVCLTVYLTKQPERAAAIKCFQTLQHKIWIC